MNPETDEDVQGVVGWLQSNRLEVLVLALLVHSTGVLTTASETVGGCI